MVAEFATINSVGLYRNNADVWMQFDDAICPPLQEIRYNYPLDEI